MLWGLLFTPPGCANSGLGPPATTDSGPATAPVCPLVGSWELQDVRCGAFPFDDWFSVFDNAQLMVSGVAGGCEVSRVVASAQCRETERMRWVVDETGGVDVQSEGVISCAPAGCSFPELGTCEEKVRADTEDELHAELDGSGLLELTDRQPDGTLVSGAVGCKLDVVTIWARGR